VNRKQRRHHGGYNGAFGAQAPRAGHNHERVEPSDIICGMSVVMGDEYLEYLQQTGGHLDMTLAYHALLVAVRYLQVKYPDFFAAAMTHFDALSDDREAVEHARRTVEWVIGKLGEPLAPPE
jgi:hypothetical protein